MEPKAPSPNAGPRPESQPMPQNVEIASDQVAGNSPEAVPAQQEADRPAGESVNQNQGMTLPVPMPQIMPVQDAPTDDPGVATPIKPITDSPDLADDVDVLEKEWVDKAKEIVHKTAGDPYKKNTQVTLLKADYIKKRYDKDVKVPEEEPEAA